MYSTPRGTYFANLKKAWSKTGEQTRATIYMVGSITFAFVLMFSLLGITSIKNVELQNENALLQATNDKLQFENRGLWYYYSSGEIPPGTTVVGAGTATQGMNYRLVKRTDTW